MAILQFSVSNQRELVSIMTIISRLEESGSYYKVTNIFIEKLKCWKIQQWIQKLALGRDGIHIFCLRLPLKEKAIGKISSCASQHYILQV